MTCKSLIEKEKHKMIFAHFGECADLIRSGQESSPNFLTKLKNVDEYIAGVHKSAPKNSVVIVAGFTDPAEVREKIVKDSTGLSAEEKVKHQIQNEEIVSQMRKGVCWVSITDTVHTS